MALYRKKPVIVEAVQWTPKLPIIKIEGAPHSWECGVFKDPESSTGYSIHTLEGKHEVTPNDYIITGVKGETYPCKPDIFAMTYEPMIEATVYTDNGTEPVQIFDQTEQFNKSLK
jgi:hypothetical protein